MSLSKYLIILNFLMVISCSSPLDKPYREETLEQDILEIKESIPESDLEILSSYIVVSSFDKKKHLGKNYRNLLDEAKNWKIELEQQQLEEKLLTEKARIREQERIKKLRQALTVSMYSIGYYKHDYQDYLTYQFAFENKTDSDIKAFTGLIVINDLFDKEIKQISLTYDDGILSKEIIEWNAQSEYNQFDDEDVNLKSKSIDDLKIQWMPEKIIFIVGSVLE